MTWNKTAKLVRRICNRSEKKNQKKKQNEPDNALASSGKILEREFSHAAVVA